MYWGSGTAVGKKNVASRPPYHGAAGGICQIADEVTAPITTEELVKSRMKVYNSSWFRMKIVTLYEWTLASGLHISWRCQIICFSICYESSGYNMVIKVSLYVCVCTWRWIFDGWYSISNAFVEIFQMTGNVERIQYFRHASVFWLQMTCRMDPNMEQYFNLTIQLLYLNTYPTKSVYNVLPTAKATFRGLVFFFINLFRTIQSICLAPPPPPLVKPLQV